MLPYMARETLLIHVIKLRTQRWEHFPGSSGWAQSIHMDPYEQRTSTPCGHWEMRLWEEGQSDGMPKGLNALQGLKVKQGGHEPRNEGSLTLQKGMQG